MKIVPTRIPIMGFENMMSIFVKDSFSRRPSTAPLPNSSPNSSRTRRLAAATVTPALLSSRAMPTSVTPPSKVLKPSVTTELLPALPTSSTASSMLSSSTLRLPKNSLLKMPTPSSSSKSPSPSKNTLSPSRRATPNCSTSSTPV